jgi:hypothetical protein
MLTLFQEGGFPMWFLLAFGGLTLICAGRFATRPDSSRLRLAGALGITTLFTTFTAICADLAAIGHHLPEYLLGHPTVSFSTALMQGVAEAMSPAILGFTVLSLAALLLGLGFHRERLTA